MSNKTHTISFFSYKGGAGRSTLAYNIIPILANKSFKPTKEKPMIIIDTDVDSCGMSYLVGVKKENITTENCVQYLLSHGCDTSPAIRSVAAHPFLSKLCPVGNAYGYPENEAILLMPAKDGMAITGRDNYGDKDEPFSKKIDSFLTVCNNLGIPAVIFDSAVGNTATANISNEASEIIVCCMRPTTQFTDGTERFLKSLENMDSDEIGKSFSKKNIIVVPNAIPRGETVINGDKYPDTAFSKIRNNFENRFIPGRTIHNYYFNMLDRQEFGIPVVDRFMWYEDILYTRQDLDANEKLALDRYEKLVGIIDDVLEEIDNDSEDF
ncbi:MAG: hypothetical protein J6S71_03360 [Clostridia bacterium]|nr:hypothetical protein [Clostridia bacterium]